MKDIPEQVKKLAWEGSVISFLHHKDGYDVYSVGMPPDENGIVPPTGLPEVVLFKDGEATLVYGYNSFKWL